jgi:hypothetical protein
MKYFTPDLLERFGSADDAVAGPANDEWERALERYEQYMESIEPELPEHIREFTKLLLHDAIIWSIARQGDKLIMVMRKDIPPRDVVILTYSLIAEPVINKEVLPSKEWGTVMDYMYDEFELVQQRGRKTYAQSILFGNGWEMSLRFSDVQVTLAEPVYPLPNTMLIAVPTSGPAKSA